MTVGKEGRHPSRSSALLFGLSLACFAFIATTQSAQAQLDRTKVLLVGDSITEGTISGGDGFPFAQILKPILGPGYEVVNVGCGGTTTVDWTLSNGTSGCGAQPNLFEGSALPELPTDIATIMFGTNDSVGFFEPSPIEVTLYELALSEIIDNLLAFGADTIVLMTPPRRPCNDNDNVRDRLIGYREVALEICAESEEVVCGPDVFTLLDPQDDFAGCDVHPNQRGHMRLARDLADVILALD